METLHAEQWPSLNYDAFKSTSHLLHMGAQVIGKLKLNTPFEPQWANVALWLTCRGLTTGPIPYNQDFFSIGLDMIDHQVIVITNWGAVERFSLVSMSVAQFTHQLFSILQKLKIHLAINLMPQEIANPIAFDKDDKQQSYDKQLAHAWWRILLKTFRIMQRYHAYFNGKPQPIGLMWGTFDLRDVRYNGTPIPATGVNSGYIRRNSANEAQIEIGWWPGNAIYPKPAFFSFTYPQPKRIEQSKIKPAKAHWHPTLMEFILDYDDLRCSNHPEQDLFDFFQTTYQAGSQLAQWDKKLVTIGKPV